VFDPEPLAGQVKDARFSSVLKKVASPPTWLPETGANLSLDFPRFFQFVHLILYLSRVTDKEWWLIDK
jgi:hypothetical protein